MSVNNKSTRIKYQKLALLSNLFGITTCLNKTIKQYALQIGYRVDILQVKDLFKDNGQFKTLQDFSDVFKRENRTGYANIQY